MSKFKIGDKVRLLDGSKIDRYTGGWACGMENYVGKVDTIKSIDTQWGDDRISYWLNNLPNTWDERGLERVSSLHITIEAYGNKVVAKLLNDDKVMKASVTKCSPEDTFNFETGAKLAFERLFAQEEKPLYNGKICITSISDNEAVYDLTVGKIYEIKNGKFKDDSVTEFPLFGRVIHNVDELRKYLRDDNHRDGWEYSDAFVHFMEVVE